MTVKIWNLLQIFAKLDLNILFLLLFDFVVEKVIILYMKNKKLTGMSMFNVLYALAILLLASSTFAEETKFWGAADVSAAVFLDDSHFVVANDESNHLRIYQIDRPQSPVEQINLDSFLQAEPDSPEADIEAAARVGDRIFWITSHGRNKDGKLRPSRYRFFCTHIQSGQTGGERLVIEGKPCKTLVQQLLAHPSPVQEILKQATQFDQPLSKKQREKLAPKEQGLNIEGLVYYPFDESLLIGLRNPLFKPKGQKEKLAVAVQLLNPQDLAIAGSAARFGRVLLWNLDNRGIRGMEYNSADKTFYILAGPVDSETASALFRWEGDFEKQPTLVVEWAENSSAFTPEGIAVGPDGLLWLFSDDGMLEIPVESPSQCMEGKLLPNGTCPNKFLSDDGRKTFRIQKINLNP